MAGKFGQELATLVASGSLSEWYTALREIFSVWFLRIRGSHPLPSLRFGLCMEHFKTFFNGSDSGTLQDLLTVQTLHGTIQNILNVRTLHETFEITSYSSDSAFHT
jgi:hypothetical protein